MNWFKILFIFIIQFAFLLYPQKVSRDTCFGYDPDYYESFTFFSPMSFEKFFDFNWKMEDATQNANLKEWQAYFQNKAKAEDILFIVYKASAQDLKAIRAFIQNPKASLSPSLKANSLVKYWTNNQDFQTIDYLLFAKACEPQAAYYDEWDKKKRDEALMRRLAEEGRKYYNENAGTVFLKMRYAYQAIRMAHYSAQYKQALQFYEEMVAPLFDQDKGIIRYWALAHKAGVLRAMNQNAEAAYWFSRVFDQCPSKMVSSYLSFKIKSDEEWQQSLVLCKDNEEKSNLYFMRSLNRESVGLEEMKSIYTLSPGSEKLTFLLVREINKLEKDLLQTELSKNLLFIENYSGYNRQEALKYLKEVKEFVIRCLYEKKTDRPEVWTIASGYLDYLNGESQRALSNFAALKKNSSDQRLKNQVELFEIAIQISGLKRIDDASEEEIYAKVKARNHQHLKDFMVKAFERLYKKQGNIGKAYLCSKNIYDLKVDPEMDVVNDLLFLTDKKDKTAFEKEFLLPKIDEKFPKEVLTEIKATIYFSKDNLEEAVKLYAQVPQNLIYKIQQDPFLAAYKDCQECKVNSAGKGKYNRYSLVQKLVALKNSVKNVSVDQAKYYFQLGTAYYNMSYFGNSWIALDYFRSPTDLFYRKDTVFKTTAYFDCSKAKYFFERALGISIKNGEWELAAQSCYMAARCEQNQYILSQPLDMFDFPKPNYQPDNRRYFTQLKNEFKKTAYYRTLLKECKYFNEFVNLNQK